jgi:plasmid stabilization system protein ParE
MKVVISGQARADLRSIGDWIAKDSPVRARSFIGELAGHCQSRASRSAMHPVVTTVRGRPVRRCVHGNYLIFFEIERSSATVHVLRILHGAREYAELLGVADGIEGDHD